MIIEVYASKSLVIGPQELLAKVNQHFSFKNKRASSDLFRFKKGLKWKERRIYDTVGHLPDEYLQWKREALAEMQAKVNVFPCDLRMGVLVAPTGLIPSIASFLLSLGVNPTVDDKRILQIDRKNLTGAKPSYLRRPQAEGLAAFRDPKNFPALGMFRVATGCGKTLLAQEAIREIGGKSIFLVPSQPILKQTVARFERAFGKKYVGTFGGTKKQINYITVATYQSVYKASPHEFDDFQVAFFDEVHHVGAETFFDVAIEKLRNVVYRYGLTAFEERADGGTLLVEAAVGPVIYDYPVEEGIKDKYLAKPTFMIYDITRTAGTWNFYKNKKQPDGTFKREAEIVASEEYDDDDYLKAYRHWILGNDLLNDAVAAMTQAFVEDGKSVLIMVDEKEHGDKLVARIPGAGYAVGGGKDNPKLQAEFNARKLKVLVATSTMGEGADTVPVDVLINLQGGASVSSTKQVYGRALRNEEDDQGVPQKPTTFIIDFNFPKCKMLSRHTDIRVKVAAGMGDVLNAVLI